MHVLTLFERRLCRRNLFMGEVSEGAVEAPSDRKAHGRVEVADEERDVAELGDLHDARSVA